MIRKTSIALLLLMVTFVAFSQDKQVGIWKGETSDGKVGYVELTKDGYATLKSEDGTMGGEDFVYDKGKHGSLTYTVNNDVTPHTIDFVLTNLKNGKEVKTFKGIFEFLSTGQMKLRVNFDSSSRPKDFMPEGNKDTVVFSKVSKMD